MPVLSLLQEHELLANPVFCQRVRMAFSRIAREVLAEDPQTPGHPLRVSLARTVLTPNDFTSPGLTPVIASDPVVSGAAAAGHVTGEPDSAQAAVTDEQILTAVRDAWNLTSGVTPTP
ncbi:hypothetical protein [Streptomyces griseocarneus]|uniref:hypothetical protein n=1 Tax=Streptomyces griseocarneus TaxID=51201 RepID=UPI00167DB343|nr:hypothetical protein [Streptomyces griseocarneus]MBZ6476652.1 hypothetical protein [Streptomyces griseocarneus]GHG80144.1 hypothetical protein GCM10018779_61450 [Streptomyces griseocarneus]